MHEAREDYIFCFSVIIRYIETSGKMARSASPIVELLCHTNVWK